MTRVLLGQLIVLTLMNATLARRGWTFWQQFTFTLALCCLILGGQA